MSIIKPRQYGEPIHEDAPGFNPTVHRDLVEEINEVLEVVAPQQYTEPVVLHRAESAFTDGEPFLIGAGGSLEYRGGRVVLTEKPPGWWRSGPNDFTVESGGLRLNYPYGPIFATFGGSPRTAQFRYSVDIQLLADHSGQAYRHPGLFIQTADEAVTGVRLAHIAGSAGTARWYMTRYMNGTEDPGSALGVNTTEVNALTVGGPAVRITMQGDLQAGYIDAWANDVHVGRFTLVGGFSAARLGFFHYMCDATYRNITVDGVPTITRSAGSLDLSSAGVIQHVSANLSGVNATMEVSLDGTTWHPHTTLPALLPPGTPGQGRLYIRHELSAQSGFGVLRGWDATVVGLKLSAEPPTGYPLVHTPLGALHTQLQARAWFMGA